MMQNEAELIEKIAVDLMDVLGLTPSTDFDDLVGMETRMEEINSLLDLTAGDDVKIIGIVGPAGIGKTTTARALYNRFSRDFPFSTFIEDIRGSKEMPSLGGSLEKYQLDYQKELLSRIFKQKDYEVPHLQIFCQYAFPQNSPFEGFEELAWEVTRLAGNLPLGLRIMGASLRGKTMDEWMKAMPSLRSSLDSKIESILMFGYNGLSQKYRDLFLYIACFFVDFKVDRLKCLLANCGLDVDHGLQVLADKCFISFKYTYVAMHSILQQLGREIVKKESLKEPGKRQFLMDTAEISDVLEENTGTGTVLGIMLRMPKGEVIQISKRAFDGMNNLQFLVVEFNYIGIRMNIDSTLGIPEGLNCLPDKLRWIEWDLCPLRFWPSKFSGKFLVELSMRRSKFEKLWEGIKEVPSSMSTWSCLYNLNMSGCSNLEKFPNVPDSVELLNLGSTGIEEVPPWIEKLSRLRQLIMNGCQKLKRISRNISKLENLELLVLGFSVFDDRAKDYEYIASYPHLFEAIIEWGPDLKRSWRLRSDLDVDYILPICLPENALTSPVSLRLRGDCLKTIPDCVRLLRELIKLDVRGCRKLVALPPLPGSLLSIDAEGCKFLKRIVSSFQNPNLCLDFAGCIKLNKKSRKLIQTSTCKYALLPGEEVPAYFRHRATSCSLTINVTPKPLPSSFRFKACKYALLPGEEVPAYFRHRATSCSLTINLTPRPLPSSFRFKACILLSENNTYRPDHSDDNDETCFFIREENIRNFFMPEISSHNLLMRVSYCVSGKQNSLTIRSESKQFHHVLTRRAISEYLYIFEDSVSLNQDCPEAEENSLRVSYGSNQRDMPYLYGYEEESGPSVFARENEADLINKIAVELMIVLGFTPSKDFDDFVGIGARIIEIKSKFILQSEEVKVIMMVGPAGIGKTTTARVLYNQLSPGFPFSTFLENIRGSYEKPCGNDYQLKLRLQKKMLSQIFNQSYIEVGHLRVAQEKLSDKKVLVVLDEVDSWWQLEATAYQRGWFGPGSIIIITTEDRKLLKTLRLGIDHIYEMKFPTSDESLQIFCQYAFGRKSPDYGFEELAKEVTWLAGDLPLALRVMGSYLRVIKIKLFFYILHGTGKVIGIYSHCGGNFQISKRAFDGMNNLQFLAILYDGPLCMPEGLNCFPDKLRFIRWPCCPLRFWPSKFFGKFLPLHCLMLMDLSSSWRLRKIPDLSKATSLEKLDLSDCRSLLKLTSSIGSAAALELHLRYSAIEELPSSISTNLGVLDITGCKIIKDFPNVPDSIVELVLSETGIEEVPPWIENLFRLRKLDMHGCERLKIISPNISKLENLEFLALSNVYRWVEDLDFFFQKKEYCDFANYDEAIIKWGSEMKRRWRLETDFDFDYILPICLPEKALTSPISLRFSHKRFTTIPDCINHLSGLTKLDITQCRNLVALPPLPGSLLSIDAHGCGSLESIDSSSFQNPNIRLKFAKCFNLNQEARRLIQTSACKYALLPGEEVPAHFTHQATSGCLTINMAPTPLPSFLRFKACILLTNDGDDDEDENSLISCRVSGKQNGHTVQYGSNQVHHMPYLDGQAEHLYIFEDSFSLNQDFPEAEEATFSELFFEFRIHNTAWKVKGCGVRLLEEVVPQCILDGKETEDEECRGINIEASNENAGGEDKEKEDDDDGGEGAEDEVDEGVDAEEDIDGNDAVFSNAGIDINIEANNETEEEEEGEESGIDEDSETMIRKRKSLGLGFKQGTFTKLAKQGSDHAVTKRRSCFISGSRDPVLVKRHNGLNSCHWRHHPAVVSVQCFGRKKTAVAFNGCPTVDQVLLLGKHRFAGVDTRIRVKGGGHTSQVYAIRQSIAKALVNSLRVSYGSNQRDMPYLYGYEEESRRDEDAEMRSMKQMRVSLL
ncbi:hypothetical protein HID58_004610 [Brassica napus]|uniref:ADP-ribosyl cyclase/cyclic ADP-ribose hydrolase n=1 Tax=Brassica napus TaxID=3708 RepID=A0ABQ8E699_BRANA|nr:hypothetical protein HID58_004610 [Brassica napus]